MSKEIPKEALKFAKQMGIDLNGLEAEAEDIWTMLNDMSEKNFDEYQSFIQQQFKEQKEAEANGQGNSKDDASKFIRPTAGFSVQTMTQSGDGIKVRSTDEKGNPVGKVIYINICSHDAIDPPTDYNGAPIKGDWTSEINLQIPLVVGTPRDLEENSKMAIDAIVHTTVLSRCNAQSSFKTQIVELVMETITAERAIKLKTSWCGAARSYMGGRGADKLTPVMFPVDSSAAGKCKEDAQKQAMQSPTMLLSALKQERDAETLDESNVFRKSNAAAPQPEIWAKEPCNASTQSCVKDCAPLLKKGFLNNKSKNVSLYPEEGSSEGQGGATGGVYERLMSRCQVVDAAALPTSTPKGAFDSKTTVPKKDTAAPPPSRNEIMKMEMLLGQVDDEWGGAEGGRGGSPDDPQEFAKALESMSKTLLDSSSFAPLSKDSIQFPEPPSSSLNYSIVGTFANSKGKIELRESLEKDTKYLEITISELNNISSFNSDVVLEVGQQEILIAILKDSVKVKKKTVSTGGCSFDASSTTASYKKKKNQLFIKVALK